MDLEDHPGVVLEAPAEAQVDLQVVEVGAEVRQVPDGFL
jgi:hypothetical protein